MYRYDVAGNLLDAYVCDLNTYRNKYATGLFYDDQYRISSQFFTFDYAASDGANAYMLHYFYAYDDETGNLWCAGINDDYMSGEIAFIYDKLNALTQKTVNLNPDGEGSFYQNIDYVYEASGDTQGDRVQRVTVTTGKTVDLTTSTVYNFAYDTNGNITEIRDGQGVIQYRYAYDSLGQLVREDNRGLNKSYVYTYDNAGNLTKKEEYAFTTETLGSVLNRYHYTYGNESWGDQLTKIGDDWIVYDQIGNPTLVGEYIGTEAYYTNGYELTWNGRELTQYRTFTDDGEGTVSYGMTITYAYNADGIRTSKTVNGIKHEYYLSGSQIMAETWVENGVERMLIYLYDESGSPIGLKYRTSAYEYDEFDCYFFEKNLQGDIIAIYNASGVKIGTYAYDAWGNFTVTLTDTNTLFENTIVNLYNPFRYRGYYYDVETGFYYLQSRYYNPEWGRFLNADIYISTGQGLLGNNMYAYCSNSPTNGCDPCGTCFHRWDFWNECDACGGRTITEKWNNFMVNVDNYVAKPIKRTVLECTFAAIDFANPDNNITTIQLGGTLSGECGFYLSLSGGIVFDRQGNFANYLTVGYGGGVGCGLTAGVNITASDAPKITYLAGGAFEMGGSVVCGLGGGVDYGKCFNNPYSTISASFLVGPGLSLLEFHAQMTYTWLLYPTNVYN